MPIRVCTEQSRRLIRDYYASFISSGNCICRFRRQKICIKSFTEKRDFNACTTIQLGVLVNKYVFTY